MPETSYCSLFVLCTSVQVHTFACRRSPSRSNDDELECAGSSEQREREIIYEILSCNGLMASRGNNRRNDLTRVAVSWC